MDQQRPPTLFVSHPSTKAETALHIERALHVRGVRCWIAPRDVEPGEQWDVSIRRAIAETDAMLVLFCADSERSRQVKRELILADQSNKAIIPMRLERIEPQELSYHLADSQWIDWIEQRDEAIERIAVKAAEFQAQRTDNSTFSFPDRSIPVGAFAAPPPYPPPPAPARGSLKWLWLTLAGLAVAGGIGFAIWFFALRGPVTPVTEEWFAGVWSDTRDCREMLRFDPGGSLTWPDASQGRWSIEAPNVLVIERGGETERRVLTIVSRSEVTSPSGRAFRCA